VEGIIKILKADVDFYSKLQKEHSLSKILLLILEKLDRSGLLNWGPNDI